jgi:hypothetical protein
VGDGDGVLGGMYDQGVNGKLGGDLSGELSQGLGIFGRCGEAKYFADFVGFFFVEAKDDIEVTLKTDDKVQGMADVVVIAFLGIGKVEEHLSTRPLKLRAEFVQDGFPDLAHVGEHGPVHKADEAGRAEFFGEALAAEALLDCGPCDLFERSMFSNHDLAVVEFERVGLARFRNGMNLGALRELGEDGVQVRMTQDAQVGDLNTEAGQGIGHDGAVAAKFDDVGNDFDVGALPGGGCESVGQLLDGGHAGKGFRIGAFINHMNDDIDETVETDKRGQLRDARGSFEKALGALFTEWVRIDHKLLLWRMALRWRMPSTSVRGNPQDAEHPFQIIVIEKVNLNSAAPLAVSQFDLRAEPFAKAGLNLINVWVS